VHILVEDVSGVYKLCFKILKEFKVYNLDIQEDLFKILNINK